MAFQSDDVGIAKAVRSDERGNTEERGKQNTCQETNVRKNVSHFFIKLWLYSSERRKSYTPRMAWGWVNHGVILILGELSLLTDGTLLGQSWPNGLRVVLVTQRSRARVSVPAGIVGGGSEWPALSFAISGYHGNKDDSSHRVILKTPFIWANSLRIHKVIIPSMKKKRKENKYLLPYTTTEITPLTSSEVPIHVWLNK